MYIFVSNKKLVYYLKLKKEQTTPCTFKHGFNTVHTFNLLKSHIYSTKHT